MRKIAAILTMFAALVAGACSPSCGPVECPGPTDPPACPECPGPAMSTPPADATTDTGTAAG